MDVLLLSWTLGILLMWCQAQYILTKRGRNIVSGTHKAVLELAAAMRTELNVEDADLHLLREEQIKQRMAAVQGGSISYNFLDSTEEHSIWMVLRAWLLHEKYLVLMMAVSILVASTIWMAPYGTFISVWISGLPCGLITALCIGTKRKSRTFFISLFITLSSVAVLVLLFLFHPWSHHGQYYSEAATKLLKPF